MSDDRTLAAEQLAEVVAFLLVSAGASAGNAAKVAENSIAFNAARFVGPAIAGVLIATLGVESVFAANAASFGVFLMALFLWRSPRST